MKNIKIVFSMAFALIMAYTLAISPAHALTVGNNDTPAGNGGDTSAPATTGNGGDTSAPATSGTATGNGGDTSAPATSGNGGNTSNPATGNGGDTSAPATTGNGGNTSNPATGNGGNTSNPATGNGGDTSAPASAPATPAPASPERGSGGRISSGTGYAVTTIGTTSLPTIINIGDCSYITTYMKFGNTNDVAEVKKLQSFLKNTEGINVDINGIFDEKTLAAVKTFQAKYVNDTMAPWGVSTPTGQVYFTTKKKINEVYCKANFKLSAQQLSEIEAYKKGLASQSTNIDSNTSTGTPTKDTMTPDVGSADAPLKANLSDTAKPGMIKGFFKWLFGY